MINSLTLSAACADLVLDINFMYLYSGTRLESIIVCSHELAQIWRQDTDTIHDHDHTKKKLSVVCNNGP